MAKQDASKENGSSLEQAQYEYRKTIYFAGLKILETFSEAVIGRDPSDCAEPITNESGGGAGAHADGAPPGGHIHGPGPSGPPPCGRGPHTEGAPPGGHIHAVIKLAEVVLNLKSAPKIAEPIAP
jgi:hypothetical protein